MKKQVHYLILEDMKKYIKDLKLDNYESSFERTDPSVLEYVRKYYNSHLPVDVSAWIRVNEPDTNLIYSKFIGDQVCFVRDTIGTLLMPSYKEWHNNLPMVISTHRSKSVKLPVFQIYLKKFNTEFILRCNFYDWKISVNSDVPLDIDFMDLFDTTQEILPIYCEGFPKENVYGCYKENHSKFTIEISSLYDLYTFFFLVKNYLGIKKEY